MTRHPRARHLAAFWPAALLLPALLAGCGRQTGHVSGTVKFQDKPLPGGWLTFRPADPKANSVPALIGPDGHYEATLPVGDVTIAVDNRELQPPERGPHNPLPPDIKLPGGIGAPKAAEAAPTSGANAAKLTGKYVPIPEKYYKAETSGLTYTIKKGDETHDIELK